MAVEGIFLDTALILAISAGLGALSLRLRQPLIVAFIAVGLLVGPWGLNFWVPDREHELLATLGIALLLFVVGLKLDFHLIRSTGPVALAVGTGQIALTFGIGFALAHLLGYPALTAFYLASALTFSSTVIIVKLLSDKREIDALHGKIDLGILIVQDVVVILTMIVLTAAAGEKPERFWVGGLQVLARGGGFIIAILLLMRYVLPKLLEKIARSQELLVLFAIAWAVLLAALARKIGLSLEVGAFLAGISLASTPFREAIAARLVTLRDFLLLFFFIAIGTHLDFTPGLRQLAAVFCLSLFVLVGKPLIVASLMGLSGYRKRTAFLSGVSLAQISEFSLILASLGVMLGHIGNDALGMITLVSVITIGLSSYAILYNHRLYGFFEPLLGRLERSIPFRESLVDTPPPGQAPDVVLFGLGRYGSQVAAHLHSRGKIVFGVDFDPEVVRRRAAAGISMRYGDAADPEMLEHLPLDQTPWVVSTIPGREVSLALLNSLRNLGYKGRIVLTAQDEEQERLFREAGADRVLWPYLDAAEQAVDVLTGTREAIFDQAPWPMTLEEVRIRPGAEACGKKLGELVLRQRSGATVVAVDRAGRSYFDPGADFMLFPGDRVVLLGGREDLAEAALIFEQLQHPSPEESAAFRIGEIKIHPRSGWVGRSLAELDLRQRIGLTVIGIRRGDAKIVSPPAHIVLQEDDVLVVLGKPDALKRCRMCLPLD